ncbi:MAG: hypothetical protein Kow0037_29380 [Calditrichia bacterium]
MKKRVCIIRHYYFPTDPRERKMANALADAGYEVDVICLRKKGERFVEPYRTGKIFRLPLGHRRQTIARYLFEYGMSLKLFSLVLLFLFFFRKYRLIQVATMPDFLVFAAWLPKLFGAKVLLDLHEPTPELWITKYGNKYPFFYRLQLKMEQKAIRFADYCLTVTETLKQRFQERGAPSSKILVVPNVCEEGVFVPQPERGKDKQGEFIFITHGLIEERYGHELVVRAICRLKEELPMIVYRIVGDGEYRPQLEKLVRKMGCEKVVQFTGFLSFEDLLVELHRADVGVIPMQRSPYSELVDTNKMYEYIAIQKPVIASRLPAVAANFPDDALLYFEPGNVEELIERMRQIYRDAKMRRSLPRQAGQIFEKLRWQKSRRSYLNLVEKMIGTSGGNERT